MKLKKLFITIAIVAILSVTFVLAISASEYDFIQSSVFEDAMSQYDFGYSSFIFPQLEQPTITFMFIVSVRSVYIRPYDFQFAVDKICGTKGDCTYDVFKEACIALSNNTYESPGVDCFFQYWKQSLYGCDEAYFNKLYNYKEITQEELDAKDAQIAGLTNSIDTVDKMYQVAQNENVALRNQNSSLTVERDNLLSANATLQVDVESLETQVADLVGEKTTINSELMAMEAKLEREKAKSYLQGYEDATGFNWMPVIAGLSVLSMIVTIVSLCIRARKKKR